MTRKDYELLAGALRAAYGMADSDDSRKGIVSAAVEISKRLAEDNPRFSGEKFADALFRKSEATSEPERKVK